MQREPERCGARAAAAGGVQIVEREGRIYWESKGRLREIERALYDIDYKVAESDRMGTEVSVISLAPPSPATSLPARTGRRPRASPTTASP